MAAFNVSNQQNIPRLVLGAGTFGVEHADRFQSFVRLHGAKAMQPLVDFSSLTAIRSRIEETLQAVDTLYKQGKFREFGLSNFSARQIEEIIVICGAQGYIAPAVYQGLYSLITRADYLAHHNVLKKHGIRYYAYGAMVSGLLTGKHKFDKESNTDTRLHSSSWFSDHLKQRLAALDLLTKAADKEGIPLAQATNRWMRHHSDLTKQDAILVGVSSLKQLDQNLHDLEMGPLPPVLVDAFEDAWKTVEHIQIITVPSALDNEK
ncbi:Aflatoxin B1 aldehyde reductase member 2 [Podila clonocystis]|nr:Aflatoxin B1 aldehyde reductase member 2 [Podila clonocystis]